MKTSEIRELSDKELVERLDTETEVYTRLRLNHAVSPLDNPLKLRHTRRNVARLKTEVVKRKASEKSNS